ncbi:MAG: HemK/PrmC family methyltransferase [Vicinamibacterales bacterium]
MLVEAALEQFDRAQAIRILDVCTGSGCVAVGLGREFPRAALVASDISEAALEIAQRNVARYGLTTRIQCVRTDLLEGLPGPFDLIVANPPYVPSGDAATMQPEVLEFEPSGALFAGVDGLLVIRRLIRDAASALAPEGILVFEFGAGQAPGVEALLKSTPSITLLEVKHDLQDIPRAAVVQKTSKR